MKDGEKERFPMLPEQFLQRMQEMLGAEYDAFLESFSVPKYQALRINTLKKNEQGENPTDPVQQALALKKVSWAANGYYYESDKTPGKHPYHEAGMYYIQEPSAMAPVTLLAVRPGEKILDLCAAPGGKSTQIAAELQGQGLLVCNEIHPARAKILSENIERMGVVNACVTNETPKHLAELFPEYFDRILVDAPCSGEGMFRKNEAACEEWSPENVELCGDRQDEILDCAAVMLRPGGRLVYSTCTFAPKENEGSISRFIERHPEFHIVPIDKECLFADAEGVCDEACMYSDGVAEYVDNPAVGIEGTLRLWPHHIKGEGHYAAVLQKAGQVSEQYESMACCGLEPGATFEKLQKQKDMAEFVTFCRETLGDEGCLLLQGKFLRFGENLYLAPGCMPGLKGLKVLRPGLHLGTMKKNRFEPSHALALALSPKEVLHVWQLSSEEDTPRAYLSGQTFPAEGEKGWYLICVDGFSIGWGKLAGGIMKNHYPKGLRK